MEAKMPEVAVGSWSRDPQVPLEMLESLRGLNHRFLDLLATRTSEWRTSPRAGVPVELAARVAPLSTVQKGAIATCPYALFDLRFHEDEYWLNRLQAAGQWHIHDEAGRDDGTSDFVRLALFFAWHVASTTKFAARLLLGMNEATSAAFRGITIDCIPALCATEAMHLAPRWSDRPTYWDALTRAAARPNPAVLRRVQLSGLQLAAAVHLS